MMNFQEFVRRLDMLGMFSMDLTLGRMAAFVERAGRPRFRVLHVVGTNGKGSTATILAELLRVHGFRVGLYTSPHFVSVRERVRVDGRMLSEADWARLGGRALALSEGLGLTYFEVLTAVAVLAFAEAGCDAAVMEAGLGGRYDATSVLDPDLTVYTPIGLDHIKILGPTLADIAGDKAGAMRPGGLAVSAPQVPEAGEVLLREAAKVGSELVFAPDVLRFSRAAGEIVPGPAGKGIVPALAGVTLGLPGPYQELNAATALAAFFLWAGRRGLAVRPEACRTALARVFIPGRFQFTPAVEGLPPLILDGGHNAHGLAALKAALDECRVQPAALVFGCLRDKPLKLMLPIVRTFTHGRVLVCGIPSCPRSCDPEKLAAALGPGAAAFSEVHAALAELSGSAGPILVCGSLYLLGEFYTNYPCLLDHLP